MAATESEWKKRVKLEYQDNRREESKPWDVVILDEAHKIKVSNRSSIELVLKIIFVKGGGDVLISF